MFYANDVLVFFHAVLWHVLHTSAILRAYDLGDYDYLYLWIVGTPGVVSGETVLLSQTAILPRVLEKADLAGDLDSEGRRTVTSTRARKLLSFHQVDECFRTNTIPRTWAAYCAHVFSQDNKWCTV